MAERSRPALASVTIRRLVLPEGEACAWEAEALSSTFATSIGVEVRARLMAQDATPLRPNATGLAAAVTASIFAHPVLTGLARGRT